MKRNKVFFVFAFIVCLLIISMGYLLYNNKSNILHQPNTNNNIEKSADIKFLIDKYYENYNSSNYTNFCENYIVEAESDENPNDVIAGCVEGLEQLNSILGKEVSYDLNKAVTHKVTNDSYIEYIVKLPVNYKKANNVNVTMTIRKYPDNTVKMYEANVNLFNI